MIIDAKMQTSVLMILKDMPRGNSVLMLAFIVDKYFVYTQYNMYTKHFEILIL